jgi:hypothetical protein
MQTETPVYRQMSRSFRTHKPTEREETASFEKVPVEMSSADTSAVYQAVFSAMVGLPARLCKGGTGMIVFRDVAGRSSVILSDIGLWYPPDIP